ncbi:PIGH (predicted) [Pycnogonum litorale]
MGNNLKQNCSNVCGRKIIYEVVRNDFLHGTQEYSLSKEEIINAKKWFLLTSIIFVSFVKQGVYIQPKSCLMGVTIVLSALVVLKFNLTVRREALLVISSLGLQFTTTFATGRKSSRFVFISDVRDVAINEYITMHCVVYCFIILLRPSSEYKDEILPLFTALKPKLDCLQKIYSGTKDYLKKTENLKKVRLKKATFMSNANSSN